jgi:type II secretory ATPase GspE/PulE/Tfp pilus assembly ATPase PilB-like protein
MIAGTFNLVMAQRLCRKICENCKTQISVKNTEHHMRAKQAFSNFEKEKLKSEISKRNVTADQRTNFVNEGVCYHGTGKDSQS